MSIENGCDGNGKSTRCCGTAVTEKTSSHHASPYVIVVTTALVTLLVSILGWMLLGLDDRELSAVAIERTKTAEARNKDLENQIKALRREQDLQNKLLRQVNDWKTLRMLQ